MNVTFRPIGTWTGPGTEPSKRSSGYQFRSPWSATLHLLDRELTMLNASNVVVAADFTEADIRLDGMPRANARVPQHPGVRIAFDSRHGPLTYATDSYKFWQHNVRGIALALEALRAVDRYGVTRTGEQYKGWRAIAAPSAEPEGPMTPQRAAEFLAEYSPASADGLLRADGFGVQPAERRLSYAFRFAAQKLHPDRGGSDALFTRLTEARAVMEAHHGVSGGGS